MSRPNCKRCNTRLTGKIRYNHTICPNCGKRWELTKDYAAIKTTVLQVQDGEHILNSPTIGDKPNG